MLRSPRNFGTALQYLQLRSGDRILWGLFVLYLLVRVLAWRNTVLLEDHDSVKYLHDVRTFLSLDLEQILRLGPDTTPLYPILGAIFSLPGWPVEIGARLASLVLSAALFWAVAGLARQLTSRTTALVALLLLTFSPPLIHLSIAVLTEPTYMAIVYIGLWLVWIRRVHLSTRTATLLGVVFALSFLTRTEGIVYLAAVPFLLAVLHLLAREPNRIQHPLLKVALFVIAFSLVAAPQIVLVSKALGSFAINGRQVWVLVLNYPDDKSYEEKIYGLDYSPSETNIRYLQEHPEARRTLRSGLRPRMIAQRITHNTQAFVEGGLSVFLGPFGAVFLAFGLLALLRAGRKLDVLLLLIFLAASLTGPVLHDVDMRHVAIAAPLLFIIAATGIEDVSRALADSFGTSRVGLGLFTTALVLLLIAPKVPELRSTLDSSSATPWSNPEYDPADYQGPAAIVAGIVANELHRPPVIVARKGYLAHFTSGKRVHLPSADYPNLVQYCALNDVDFLFLEHPLTGTFPFLDAFASDSAHAEFRLLYRSADSDGAMLEVYRFTPAGVS